MKKRWALHLAPILLAAGAEAWAQGVYDEGDVPSTGIDFDFQASLTTIRANWDVSKPNYSWAIGTTPGGTDVTGGFVSVGAATNAVYTGTLTPGAIYYVTVQDGMSSTWTSDGITVVRPPVVTPASGPAPLMVSFRQQAGGVMLYEWNFDAPTAWNPNLPAGADLRSLVSGDASFVYAVPGAREAELKMHHVGGELLIQRVPVQVDPSPGAPTVSLATVPSPPTGSVPLTVTFTAAAQSFDGTVLAYLWDFDNDGVPDASGESPTIVHTFRAPGNILAGVTVVDAAGNVATQTVTVDGTGQVGTLPTVSWAGIAPSPAQVGDVVTFTALGNSGGADALTAFLWDFDGDGVTDRITGGPGPVTWRFEGPGSYTPRVTVVDGDGLSDTASGSLDVFLEPAVKRCWILHPSPNALLFGDHVSLLAAAVPPDSVTAIEFRFRRTGILPWTPIGTTALGYDLVPGLHWDVSALMVGVSYDLVAVATFADGTTDVYSPVVLVTVSADEAGADVAEYSGSPVTRLLLAKLDPNATTLAAIQRDTVIRVPPGAVPSYDQMRLERRGDNPYPVEARLQGLRFLPNHFRRVGLSGASGFGKPSRAAMYLGTTTGTRLADGTDLARASFKICRFNTGLSRWEPLPDSASSPKQGLIQASLTTPGDLGVAVFLDREEPDSSSGCGGLGVEAVLLLWVLIRRRRKDGRDER